MVRRVAETATETAEERADHTAEHAPGRSADLGASGHPAIRTRRAGRDSAGHELEYVELRESATVLVRTREIDEVMVVAEGEGTLDGRALRAGDCVHLGPRRTSTIQVGPDGMQVLMAQDHPLGACGHAGHTGETGHTGPDDAFGPG